MRSADIIKWTKPKAAAEWEWNQERSLRLHALRTWLIWFPPLAAITGYIIFRLDSAITLRTVRVLIFSYGFFPLWFYLIMWLQCKVERPRYEIHEKGLLFRAGRSSRFYRWKDIEYYRISDSSEVPGLRKLEFKPAKSRKIKRWFFDPNEVDESKVTTALNDYLLGKYWENLSSV